MEGRWIEDGMLAVLYAIRYDGKMVQVVEARAFGGMKSVDAIEMSPLPFLFQVRVGSPSVIWLSLSYLLVISS